MEDEEEEEGMEEEVATVAATEVDMVEDKVRKNLEIPDYHVWR